MKCFYMLLYFYFSSCSYVIMSTGKSCWQTQNVLYIIFFCLFVCFVFVFLHASCRRSCENLSKLWHFPKPKHIDLGPDLPKEIWIRWLSRISVDDTSLFCCSSTHKALFFQHKCIQIISMMTKAKYLPRSAKISKGSNKQTRQKCGAGKNTDADFFLVT